MATALVAFGVTADAFAQASAGLRGIVRDSTGTPIVGAVGRIHDTSTVAVREVWSGPSGEFAFTGLVPARLQEIEILFDGFRPSRRAVDPLAAGEHRQVDVTLEPAGPSERIHVSADAPLGVEVTPQLGGRLGRDRLDRVPVNGRDLVALAYLMPGAAPARGFYNLAPRLTINGASSLVANYSVDGFDNTDLFLGGPKVPFTIGATTASRSSSTAIPLSTAAPAMASSP